MKVVLYRSDKSSGELRAIEASVTAVVDQEHCHRCRKIEDLAVRLRSFEKRPEIAILLASDQGELEQFISLQEWLEDVRIILILRECSLLVLRRAHTLRPRLILPADADHSILGAVLHKMVGDVRLIGKMDL
jgi:hypothetical protein